MATAPTAPTAEPAATAAASASTAPSPPNTTISSTGADDCIEDELESGVVPRLSLEEGTEPVLRAFLEANRPVRTYTYVHAMPCHAAQ